MNTNPEATPGAVRRVLLIRHGQSEWNAQGRWQGQADPPLTELGEQQARLAAAHLPEVGALATSTLERARRTGVIIAETLGLDEPRQIDELKERDAGEFSGLTRVEIEEQYPGYLGTETWPPGWEDDAELIIRVREGIAALLALSDAETLAVITHGGVIYNIEASLGRPWERIGNLGASWLHVGPDGWEWGGRTALLPEHDQTVPDQI